MDLCITKIFLIIFQATFCSTIINSRTHILIALLSGCWMQEEMSQRINPVLENFTGAHRRLLLEGDLGTRIARFVISCF